MTFRLLPAVLAFAVLPGGSPADPFAAVLEAEGGEVRVAAPRGDPLLDAVSWSTRPRRETVDGLAALLLRGELAGGPADAPPPLAAPPVRVGPVPDADSIPVTDRLAWWVPSDAAAVFFPSLAEGSAALERLAKTLPGAFPALAGDPPAGRREAFRRAWDRLLLPTIWRANPGVRTGTRQVALVVSDPDLRWAPEIALLCEVEDAGLLLAQRRASFRWEDRYASRLRIDGLDATTDDGAVRSFFALEGGTAVFATSRSLRDRVLAAGAGRAPSMLRPDRSAWALARRTFPAEEGGALLVVPDGFLARVSAPETRLRRAEALACEAARLLLDARSLRGPKASSYDTLILSCPSGGTLYPKAESAGSLCTVHGTAAAPVPLGDLPEPDALGSGRGALSRLEPERDPVLAAAVPVAALYRVPQEGPGFLEILVPPERPGRAVMECLSNRLDLPSPGETRSAGGAGPRLKALARTGRPEEAALAAYAALTGLVPTSGAGEPWPDLARGSKTETVPGIEGPTPVVPPFREGGGLLRIPLEAPRWVGTSSFSNQVEHLFWSRPMEWR